MGSRAKSGSTLDGRAFAGRAGKHDGCYGLSGVAMWRERIASDPRVCHGQACIRGTRVLVSVVLDNLAAGMSPEEIAASYPSVTPDDVRAAVSYAAELARERVIPLESSTH